MKDFDLEAAKKGAKVIDPVNKATGEFLTELKTDSDYKFVFVMINQNGNQYVEEVDENGEVYGTTLKMAPVKHNGYINIYPNRRHGAVYKTMGEADKYATYDRLAVATVEWEE